MWGSGPACGHGGGGNASCRALPWQQCTRTTAGQTASACDREPGAVRLCCSQADRQRRGSTAGSAPRLGRNQAQLRPDERQCSWRHGSNHEREAAPAGRGSALCAPATERGAVSRSARRHYPKQRLLHFAATASRPWQRQSTVAGASADCRCHCLEAIQMTSSDPRGHDSLQT